VNLQEIEQRLYPDAMASIEAANEARAAAEAAVAKSRSTPRWRVLAKRRAYREMEAASDVLADARATMYLFTARYRQAAYAAIRENKKAARR
jgi:hypothetical protein